MNSNIKTLEVSDTSRSELAANLRLGDTSHSELSANLRLGDTSDIFTHSVTYEKVMDELKAKCATNILLEQKKVAERELVDQLTLILTEECKKCAYMGNIILILKNPAYDKDSKFYRDIAHIKNKLRHLVDVGIQFSDEIEQLKLDLTHDKLRNIITQLNDYKILREKLQKYLDEKFCDSISEFDEEQVKLINSPYQLEDIREILNHAVLSTVPDDDFLQSVDTGKKIVLYEMHEPFKTVMTELREKNEHRILIDFNDLSATLNNEALTRNVCMGIIISVLKSMRDEKNSQNELSSTNARIDSEITIIKTQICRAIIIAIKSNHSIAQLKSNLATSQQMQDELYEFKALKIAGEQLQCWFNEVYRKLMLEFNNEQKEFVDKISAELSNKLKDQSEITHFVDSLSNDLSIINRTHNFDPLVADLNDKFMQISKKLVDEVKINNIEECEKEYQRMNDTLRANNLEKIDLLDQIKRKLFERYEKYARTGMTVIIIKKMDEYEYETNFGINYIASELSKLIDNTDMHRFKCMQLQTRLYCTTELDELQNMTNTLDERQKIQQMILKSLNELQNEIDELTIQICENETAYETLQNLLNESYCNTIEKFDSKQKQLISESSVTSIVQFFRSEMYKDRGKYASFFDITYKYKNIDYDVSDTDYQDNSNTNSDTDYQDNKDELMHELKKYHKIQKNVDEITESIDAEKLLQNFIQNDIDKLQKEINEKTQPLIEASDNNENAKIVFLQTGDISHSELSANLRLGDTSHSELSANLRLGDTDFTLNNEIIHLPIVDLDNEVELPKSLTEILVEEMTEHVRNFKKVFVQYNKYGITFIDENGKVCQEDTSRSQKNGRGIIDYDGDELELCYDDYMQTKFIFADIGTAMDEQNERFADLTNMKQIEEDHETVFSNLKTEFDVMFSDLRSKWNEFLDNTHESIKRAIQSKSETETNSDPIAENNQNTDLSIDIRSVSEFYESLRETKFVKKNNTYRCVINVAEKLIDYVRVNINDENSVCIDTSINTNTNFHKFNKTIEIPECIPESISAKFSKDKLIITVSSIE